MERERHTEKRWPGLVRMTVFPRESPRRHGRTSSHTERRHHVYLQSPEGKVSVGRWASKSATRTLTANCGGTNFVPNIEIEFEVLFKLDNFNRAAPDLNTLASGKTTFNIVVMFVYFPLLSIKIHQKSTFDKV